MDYEDSFHPSDDESASTTIEDLERTVSEAPIENGALDTFLSRGRHVYATAHPYLSQGLAWISTNSLGKASNLHRGNTLQDVESFVFQTPYDYDGLFSSQRTRLLADLAHIYEELQFNFDNDEPDIESTPIVSDASIKYRERILETIKEITEASQLDELSVNDEAWQQSMLESITVRQCAEAIYFPPNQGSLLCDKLMDWVNVMDPRPTTQEGEEIMTTRRPYLHPGFWDYVAKGILRGLLEMVGTCLNNSGLSNVDGATSQATNDLCLLLRTCPRASSYLTNAQSFRERHRVWRSKVVKVSKDIQINNPEISTAFRQIYELLKGDKDAIYRQSDSWQECLAALALLFDPAGLRSSKDVRALFEMITESDDFALSVDRTLASEDACAALCGELIPKAITRARAVDLALATHLADMLDKVEVLDDIRSGDLDLTIREVLALAQGDACIAISGTWRAAITYWKAAGDAGYDSIQQVLVRVSVDTQATVDDLLSICNDLDLLDEAAEIESIWARKLEDQGKYYEAIVAYDRADSRTQIDRLNWLLTERSLVSGRVMTNDQALLESLRTPQSTSSTTIATLMAPFATLAAMYRLQASNEYAKAALYLSALIHSADVPKSYMGILMAEMLPFLQLPPHESFSMRDIFDSLAAIEDFYDSDQFETGVMLLQKAINQSTQSPSEVVKRWRTETGHKLEAADVLALVRLRIAETLATRFCQN